MPESKPGDVAAKADTADCGSIVGVGASAGGLDAFTRLLRHLPSDTGAAFVLVQHLALTKKILERAGYVVIVASNGAKDWCSSSRTRDRSTFSSATS